jgi:peptide/nickel transport system permease protein
MMVPPDEVFDEDVREALAKELGLDRPILVQYGDWLWHALHGDFGESIFTPARAPARPPARGPR